MKRLLAVAAGTLVLALVLGVAQKSRSPVPVPAPEEPSFPRFDVEVELGASGLAPYRVQVPKDRDVHVLVRGAPDAQNGMLTLLGYEDRVSAVDVGPGVSREMVFTSVRPGDDFGFSFRGEIVGRLEVTGGHLEEGHR